MSKPDPLIRIYSVKEIFNLKQINLDDLVLKYRTGPKVYVGLKDLVYDVSKNEVYKEGGGYHAFAGRDASVALAKMNFLEENFDHSLHHWSVSLSESETKVLEEWVVFFNKRYQVVARLPSYRKMSDGKFE